MAGSEQSWFGPLNVVTSFLEEQGADMDAASGSFLIAGKPVVSGIGGGEVIIPPETVYFVNGKEAPLASALWRLASGGRQGVPVRLF